MTSPISQENKENVRKRRLESQEPSPSSESIECRNVTLVSVTREKFSDSRKRRSLPQDILCVNDICVDDPTKNNPHLGVYDRASVICWVTEVCEAFSLTCETAQLTVNYFDRSITKIKDLDHRQVQLVALTCLYIASKLEEVFPPSITEFVDISDHLCKLNHVSRLEVEILEALDWRLRITPASTCLNHLCECYDLLKEQRMLTETDFNKQAPEVQIPRQPVKRFATMLPPIKRFIALTHTTYDTRIFARAIRILNLAILDSNWSSFSGLSLAAAALRFVIGRALPVIPNLSSEEYDRCIAWMQPFYDTMKNVPCKHIQLPREEKHKLAQPHRIQLCEGSVSLLKDAHARAMNRPIGSLLRNISNKKYPMRIMKKRARIE